MLRSKLVRAANTRERRALPIDRGTTMRDDGTNGGKMLVLFLKHKRSGCFLFNSDSGYAGCIKIVYAHDIRFMEPYVIVNGGYDQFNNLWKFYANDGLLSCSSSYGLNYYL